MGKVDVKEILRQVLEEEGIPSNCYSLDGYLEGAVCLDDSVMCYVYYAEKGCRHKTKGFPNVISACNEVIARVAESNMRKIELQNSFHLRIMKEKYN